MSGSLRLAVVLAVMLALVAPGTITAKSTNDLYRSATVISSLPFSETLSTTTATSEPGEPSGCALSSNNSVWYTYTPPTNQAIRVSTRSSSYDALPQMWVVNGHGFANLTPLSCNNGGPVQVTGGTTYAIQVIDQLQSGGGGTLVLSIQQATPPGNDNFETARPVTTLPFTDRIDFAAATLQAGEPAGANCEFFGPMIASAWYAYSPAVNGQLKVSWSGGFEAHAVVYTGSSLGTLTQLGCGFRPLAVSAGTTYYIQIAAETGRDVLDIELSQPPPPQAFFRFDPAEPNSVDAVSFFDQSFDPAGGLDFSEDWSFGDGSTFSGFNPTHVYAADGDYVAGLRITTPDGRTASTQHTISVRTHDVGITGVSAPKSARSGQTKVIAVSIVNRRYAESSRFACSAWTLGVRRSSGTRSCNCLSRRRQRRQSRSSTCSPRPMQSPVRSPSLSPWRSPGIRTRFRETTRVQR